MDELLLNIHQYPGLIPHQEELRRIRDHLHGLVPGSLTDFDMHTRVLDGMRALVDEADHMPVGVRCCMAMAVLSYLSEELVRLHEVSLSRPLTEDERRFGDAKVSGTNGT